MPAGTSYALGRFRGSHGDELVPLAPFLAGQIFQSRVNDKAHVIQLMVAAAAEKGDDDPGKTRRDATALMTERAMESAITGLGVQRDRCVRP